MTIMVSVYEKNGVKRGPFIHNAMFRIRFTGVNLPAAGPGPLTGLDPFYTVTNPPGSLQFWLVVFSPAHWAWYFIVMDGERHEV